MTPTRDTPARILKKFAREFAAYERLAAATQGLVDANYEKVVHAPGRPSTWVVAALFAKAWKTVHAIHLLAREGYGEDAMDLARTLTNLCIDLGYICHNDSDNRARQWMAVGPLERMKMRRDVAGKLTKRQEARYARLKAQTKSWTELRIEGRAKQSGRFTQYAIGYRHGSSYSHSDSWSTASYLKETDHAVQALNEPSEACVDEALHSASLVAYDIVTTWGTFYGMDTTTFNTAAQSILEAGFDTDDVRP